MANFLKNAVKQAAHTVGVDIRRHDSLALEHSRLALMLAAHQVDLVLDIGANTGQWSQALRLAGYAGDVLSFEPLQAAYNQLAKNASRDPRWTVAPRMAVGERTGEVEIHVAGNSVSSSLLPMLAAHVEGAPESAYVRSERTAVNTLDSLIGSVIPSTARRIFCKLDVQGYEDKVLAGAQALLENVTGIQMELSLAPLYEGQTPFGEMLERMSRLGFEPYGFVPGFVNPKDGRMLQVDGVFFRAAPEDSSS